MKPLTITLTILLLTTISCVSENGKTDKEAPKCYIENRLSFFNPDETTFEDGKYQGSIYETWLRQPDNLRMIHETFKKIGYDKLIADYELTSNPSFLWGYVNRPTIQIIDSLVITYPLDTIETKYYREFWQRRKNEHNHEVVFDILQELSQNLLKGNPVDYNKELVNDTLYNLLLIDRVHKNPTEQQAQDDFDYLKRIGMHGSAFNLLFEFYSYQDIDWNKDELVKQLHPAKKSNCPNTWIVDDTK